MGDGEGEDGGEGVKFCGTIYKGQGWNGTDDYVVSTGGSAGLCTGFSNDLLYEDRFHHWAGEGPSWGYEGAGPDKTSIMLLGRSLDPYWPYDCWNYITGAGHPKRSLILKLYKQFTAEIVANFGDKWSITDDEILEWVKEKELKEATA